jgi:hypothetical protein
MYPENDYPENDYTENEIDTIAMFYHYFKIIETKIEVGLEFFMDDPTEEGIRNHQNALAKEKIKYETLCAELFEFPENVHNYPLLNKTRKSIDNQIQLIHLSPIQEPK